MTEKKCDGVDRGRKTNENVMVEGKHRGFLKKKNEHQPLPETQTIITDPMGKVGNVVTLCVLWYTPSVLINLDLNKTSMIKHMRSVTRTPTPTDVR